MDSHVSGASNMAVLGFVLLNLSLNCLFRYLLACCGIAATGDSRPPMLGAVFAGRAFVPNAVRRSGSTATCAHRIKISHFAAQGQLFTAGG